MGGDDLALGGEPANVGGRRHLAGMGPQSVDPRVGRGVGPHERLQAHASRDVGELRRGDRVREEKRPDARHLVGAVQEGQALLGLEDERAEARRSERGGSRQAPAVVPRLPLADQDERRVRQRDQVARGAERAPLRHHRGDAAIQALDEEPHDGGADPGVPARERPGEAAPHGARLRRRHRGTEPAGVASQEVELKRAPLVGRDADVLQLPDAGRDPVDERVAVGQPVHEGPPAAHAPLRLVGKREGPAGARDPDDVVEAQGATERDGAHAGVPASGRASIPMRSPSSAAAAPARSASGNQAHSSAGGTPRAGSRAATPLCPR